MFDNIGGKIKVLAKVLCWLGIISSVIFGIAIIAGSARFNSSYGYSGGSPILVGILAIIFGSLISWVGSFFTYGFGQLIENTDSIRSNTQHKDKD